MRWNWQQPDWPEFRWDAARLVAGEQRFLVGGGVLVGTASHLTDDARGQHAVDGLVLEAMTTSEIEGEYLDRASVQSSVQRQLGLKGEERRAGAAERGISELLIDLYRNVATPLTAETLFAWHRMVTAGRGDLDDVGRYRTSTEPMQIVSGPSYARKIHFEAPPSDRMAAEMDRFVAWFNASAPDGPQPLPALTRAGLAHLRFESIHPFEDGNGRIGRAVAEKALAQNFHPTMLIALAATILTHRQSYYEALEAANKGTETTEWLVWFAGIALEAQQRTTAQVEFSIEKARLLERLRGRLNPRQEKALLRMLEEGPQGFKGGLSAGNYMTITDASRATATRDLAEMVEVGVLVRTGELRHTRYEVNLPGRVRQERLG